MISKTKRIIGIILIIMGLLSIIAACIGFGIPVATTFNHMPICAAGIILGIAGIFAGAFITSFED